MIVNYIKASAEDKEIIQSIANSPRYLAAYREPSTVEGMRSGNRLMLEEQGLRGFPGHIEVLPELLGGVVCERLHSASVTGERAILFLHGGGFVRGSLDMGRPCAAGLAASSDTQVFSVGYRQAPEHPCPAALTDTRNAYLALLERGLEPLNIAVVGESCGGCLALSLPIDLQARNLPVPAGVVGICPMTDLAMRGASFEYNSGKDLITKEMGLQMSSFYIQEADWKDPLASPVYHHFRNFPPIFIGVGEHELLLSDAQYLALKADEAGVPVTFNVYDSMPHSFTRYKLAIGDKLLDDAAMWCRSLIYHDSEKPLPREKSAQQKLGRATQ